MTNAQAVSPSADQSLFSRDPLVIATSLICGAAIGICAAVFGGVLPLVSLLLSGSFAAGMNAGVKYLAEMPLIEEPAAPPKTAYRRPTHSYSDLYAANVRRLGQRRASPANPPKVPYAAPAKPSPEQMRRAMSVIARHNMREHMMNAAKGTGRGYRR